MATRLTLRPLINTPLKTIRQTPLLQSSSSISRNNIFIRTMASSNAPRTYEFLTVIPDKPGMAPKRMEFRGEHYKGLTPRIDSGEWKTGGAILHSVPKDDEASSLDFAGSSIVIVAESKEQVLKELSNDIYARSGVWDMEKIQIFPYYCAFRNP